MNDHEVGMLSPEMEGIHSLIMDFVISWLTWYLHTYVCMYIRDDNVPCSPVDLMLSANKPMLPRLSQLDHPVGSDSLFSSGVSNRLYISRKPIQELSRTFAGFMIYFTFTRRI